MNKKVKYKIGVYVTHLMEWMAQRASKEHKNWLDNIIISILNKVVSTKHLKTDYMADEWLESEPGFTIEELENFESQK
ncbi:MAG: hypothetical protein AAFY45_30570 [Bacteroidota bacterium]